MDCGGGSKIEGRQQAIFDESDGKLEEARELRSISQKLVSAVAGASIPEGRQK